MKIKDIERTANIAWSPKNEYPIYIAAGTAAQQLDASFNTNASLEVYSLNLSEPGPDLSLVSSLSSDQRFHKIIWGQFGEPNGTIIGGCDGGVIQIYNAAKLLKGESALVGKQEKHSGPVHALDFNGFQKNLFATGADDSEIFIWDLNNTSAPMSPGAKSQPLEDVLSVAWNKQVQHILASTFPSKCVIWDLRKNEPIIKLTDTVSRVRWKVVAWHPEVATQLCLASEEDHSPIIQLWDLRFATSPLKTLENHQRGILSVAWCADDPDLLVSCGKDNRIVCWNPNSNQQNGEVLSEIAKTNQWSFDVAWCPKNPALIACPNFDGHVSVYSLMGGKTQQIQTTDKIADSFPGMDGYVEAPVKQQSTVVVSNDLTKPPKWMKRPVGASFGFGGKLITFENDKDAAAKAAQSAQPGQTKLPTRRSVEISQVITEGELVKKSNDLEKALEYGNFVEYCLNKSDSTDDQYKKYVWHFLKAHFDENPRAELLNLLGYRIEDVNEKLSRYVGKEQQNEVDNLSEDFSNINRVEDYASGDPFSEISQTKTESKPVVPLRIKTGDDTEGLITQALLLNNVEAAVELCLEAKCYADALIIATTGGADLLARTQHKYLECCEGYISSLISAMVSEDWASIVENCDLSSWKEALAAILTHASDEDLPVLCERLGNRLEAEGGNSNDAQLCYICSGSFERLVSSWTKDAVKSTTNLQELVELVTFLRKAVERQGRQVQISGSLADLLSRYASLLAAQGDLPTALAYLGTSNDDKVSALRDRLLVALGQKPSFVHEVRQQQSRRGSQRQSFTNYNAFNNTNPFHPSSNQYPAPSTQQFNMNQPPSNQFNTGLPNAQAAAQPWAPQVAPPVASFASQPSRTFSPAPQAPPPSQPPRPTSVGSTHGASSGGLPSRKYLLDPSMTSNPYGTGSSRNQFPPQPFSPTPSFQSPAYPQQNPYSPSPLNPGSNSLISNNNFNTNPLAPMPDPNVNPVPLNANYGQSEPPSGYLGHQPAVERAQPAENYTLSAPPGWNDPPVLTKQSLRSQPKGDVQPPEPITHPLYGSAPVSQPFPTNGYQSSNVPPNQPYNQSPLYPQNPPVGMYQPPSMTDSTGNFQQSFDPSRFHQNAVQGANGPQHPPQEPVQKREIPQPVEKAPIPEEHVHMKTVLDELRNRCSYAANNPQTKRKLDDVSRKLVSLYDLLREHKLSPNTLTALHQLVQMVENGDYPSGLNLHTQLVSGSDFAQIASFMPGLKVLLQCALQLQIYLR